LEYPKKESHNELLALRASLFDGNTRFPAYAACFEQLKQMTQDHLLGVVYIQISDMERVESVFGFERYEALLKRAAVHIQEMNGADYGGTLLLTQRGVYDDQFCVFAPYNLLTRSTLLSLEKIAKRLYMVLEGELKVDGLPGLSIHIGYSILHYNPFLRFERLVHRVVEETAALAHCQEETESVLHELELRQILSRQSITTLFHPIVDLIDFKVVGYEALTRGPTGTTYESPETLFSCARHSRLTHQLDHLCKVTAMASARAKPSEALLFINTLPTTLDDPAFLDGSAAELLARSGLDPARVVWELTERHPIDNYEAFVSVMKAHSEMGYHLAIDDVGTGYSSIQTITHVRPHYLKVDGSLIRDIQSNLLKQELLSSLLILAKNLGAAVIAEGVQSLEEMESLKELGIFLAQGFLFGRPSPEFPKTVQVTSSEAG
jgi:EAL domain-containing protein (putative c-di-GMP-specific phosphodiesterase class I)